MDANIQDPFVEVSEGETLSGGDRDIRISIVACIHHHQTLKPIIFCGFLMGVISLLVKQYYVTLTKDINSLSIVEVDLSYVIEEEG